MGEDSVSLLKKVVFHLSANVIPAGVGLPASSNVLMGMCQETALVIVFLAITAQPVISCVQAIVRYVQEQANVIAVSKDGVETIVSVKDVRDWKQIVPDTVFVYQLAFVHAILDGLVLAVKEVIVLANQIVLVVVFVFWEPRHIVRIARLAGLAKHVRFHACTEKLTQLTPRCVSVILATLASTVTNCALVGMVQNVRTECVSAGLMAGEDGFVKDADAPVRMS